jgi:hypothetical protein
VELVAVFGSAAAVAVVCCETAGRRRRLADLRLADLAFAWLARL